MLFAYTYVPNNLEKLQAWLKHLVQQVWCNPRRHFYLRLLESEFQDVVRETTKASRKNDYLWDPIRRIHNICRDQLNAPQRLLLSRWFDDNNNIESLCSGNAGVQPVTYQDIEAINPTLAEELDLFCTNLWTHVRKLKPVCNRVGTLEEHFKAFKHINRIGICPFCGISRIEGVFSDIQEDFDHYLPKGTYPFNAVAMKNLAPICDKCNKKFKLQKDPLIDNTGARRRAFYCYAAVPPGINIRINIVQIGGAPIDPSNLSPNNVQLEITASGWDEELDGWKELFDVVSRYKDICCGGDAGGNYWLEQVLGEMKCRGLSPTEALAVIVRAASVSKWADMNFIKVPFLNACSIAGIIR